MTVPRPKPSGNAPGGVDSNAVNGPSNSATRYPRASVLEHRGRLVDLAKEALAKAVGEREAREVAKARADGDVTRAETARAEIKAQEAARLLRGELRAEDLTRQAAWENAVQAELAELHRKVAAAINLLEDGVAKEREALSELANRKADVDVLEKDRERYLLEERKKTEAREEEASAEARASGAHQDPRRR